MDVLLACFLLSFLSILYFSMLVCVCYPGWRVFRTSHTCIYPFLERTIHACVYPFPNQFSPRIARLYAFIVSARMFLERAIHAFFPFNFSNRYFGSHCVFRTSHTCILPFRLQLFQLRFYIRLLFWLAC